MSRNDLMTTVVGWAATKPKEVVGSVPFTSFRIASTPRYFDPRQGVWVDGRTEWLTVKVFRDVALNVASSINKGDPVVVHGRLRTEEWHSETGLRTTVVVEAMALGHDLTRGRSVFAKTERRTADAAADVEVAEAAEVAEHDGERREPLPDVADPWAVEPPAQQDDAGDRMAGPTEDLPALTP